MKFTTLLVSIIFLSLFDNNVLFEFLIGIVRMPAQRGSLFEELENVDHQFIR